MITGGGVSRDVIKICVNENFKIVPKAPLNIPRKEHSMIIIGYIK